MCAGLAAATAEALKPDADVDGIIQTALSYLSEVPRKEVQQGLDWTKNADNWKDLRPLYEDKYRGHPISNAVEILSGGLACFYLANGDPKNSILYAVNLGRDTDCKAYVSGGLAGALKGIDAVPADWVKKIEEEVVNDPYTVSTLTARETAEGLYKAAINTLHKMKDTLKLIETMI